MSAHSLQTISGQVHLCITGAMCFRHDGRVYTQIMNQTWWYCVQDDREYVVAIDQPRDVMVAQNRMPQATGWRPATVAEVEMFRSQKDTRNAYGKIAALDVRPINVVAHNKPRRFRRLF